MTVFFSVPKSMLFSSPALSHLFPFTLTPTLKVFNSTLRNHPL